MKEKIKCLICGEQTIYVIDNFYRYHVQKFHPEIKSTKEYYDLCIKKEGEEICECGKVKNFLSYERGYAKYCSQKCVRSSEEFRKNLSQVKKDVYSDENRKKEIVEKLQKTSIEKYGAISYSSTEDCKNKVKATSLEKYGLETTLALSHVKEARERALEENKEEINEKRRAFWTEENIKRVNANREKYVLETYGVKCVSLLDSTKEKQKISALKTCQERYGVDNVMKVPEISKLVRETNERNGRWSPLEDSDEMQSYSKKVWIVTNRVKNKLYSEWNGLDYYTNEKLISNEEYAKNNPDVHFNTNALQPSIDHKKSIFYGFKNNISPEEIGDISNLCVCSRSTNSCKSFLCEDDFIKILNMKG